MFCMWYYCSFSRPFNVKYLSIWCSILLRLFKYCGIRPRRRILNLHNISKAIGTQVTVEIEAFIYFLHLQNYYLGITHVTRVLIHFWEHIFAETFCIVCKLMKLRKIYILHVTQATTSIIINENIYHTSLCYWRNIDLCSM